MIDEQTKIIDKDSPYNLSERDKLVYGRWLQDIWSISYSEYLGTDHWAIVTKENAIRWRVCALSKRHTKLPMVTHHRDDPRGGYPCMWGETFDDVILVCKDCHERFHDIWPEVNCKGSRYAGSIVISQARNNINKICEKNNVPIKSVMEAFSQLLHQCQSEDKELRDSSRYTVSKIILANLDKYLNHSAQLKAKIKVYLVEFLYSWKTNSPMPDLQDFYGEPIERYKVEYIFDECSEDVQATLLALADMDVYKKFNIAL